MPIHVSWRSMVKSMLANASYCKRNPKRKCYPFTDGKKVCGCAGGWSVFFATVNKMGADDTKPRPKGKTQEAKVLEWFIESTLKSSDVKVPPWVGMAQRVLKSPKFSDKVKAYWKSRLQAWCKKNPKHKICKGESK